MRLIVLSMLVASFTASADRVSSVRARREADVKAMLSKVGLSAPIEEVYVRVFKEERQVELWASSKAKSPLVLVKTWSVCAASGELGPKRQEGDLQVPEGLYEISEFNAASNYHLALKVSYPNASDRVRSDQKYPGGLIYMHGKCASIGCVAIEDEQIEEVYLLTLDAKKKPSRIDLFPRRLSLDWLDAQQASPHAAFWKELWPAYQQFEATHRVPAFLVDRKTGAYVVRK